MAGTLQVKHLAEQYNPRIRSKLEIVENSFQKYVQKKLNKIQKRILQYAYWRTSIVKKSKANLENIFTSEDFNLDLEKEIYPAIEIGIADERKKLDNMKSLPILINMKYGYDIYKPFNIAMYRSRLAERGSFLSKVLEETTVDKADKIIEHGIVEGKPFKDIAEDLHIGLGMDGTRAMLIARTEVAQGLNDGRLLYLKNIGVKQYNIDLAPNACSKCVSKEIEGPFDINNKVLLIHPNCRCVATSVIPKEWLKPVTQEELESVTFNVP